MSTKQGERVTLDDLCTMIEEGFAAGLSAVDATQLDRIVELANRTYMIRMLTRQFRDSSGYLDAIRKEELDGSEPALGELQVANDELLAALDTGERNEPVGASAKAEVAARWRDPERVWGALRALEAKLTAEANSRLATLVGGDAARVQFVAWDGLEPWGLRIAEISVTQGQGGSSLMQVDSQGLGACAIAERAILMRAFLGRPEFGYTEEDVADEERKLMEVVFGPPQRELTLILDVHAKIPEAGVDHDYVRVHLDANELERIATMAKLASDHGLSMVCDSDPCRMVPLQENYASAAPEALPKEFPDDRAPRLDGIAINVSQGNCYWSGGIRHHDANSDWYTGKVDLATILPASGVLDLRE